jgi:Kef-type K+ transport system membrane component KefB
MRESWTAKRLGGLVVAYLAMVALALVVFFGIRWVGEVFLDSHATVPQVPRVEAPADPHPLLHLLVTMAAVILLGRVLAKLFSYVQQPPVIGEVLAGICLGPSLLGLVWPAAGAFLLPPSVASALSVVAQLGVIVYMFLVGLELNADGLRRQGHAAVAISHASIIAPFLLGAGVALWLYPTLAPTGVPFTTFALFMGVAMSITAFPVLARILTDRGLHRSELGATALACAATDDVTAWCLLALVVGVAQADVQSAALVTLLTVGYMAVMYFIVRPLMKRVADRYFHWGLTPEIMAGLLVGMLLSALATEAIGIHAIFGAFMFGAIIPHDGEVVEEMISRLRDFVTMFLLPAFFALTGMRTEIALVSGWQNWAICLVIILLATAGKFGGTLAAARFVGVNWRDSISLGVLMNTRGLMELIVLNIGLDLGVISPTLFAMMVIMAIVTTMATSPILYTLMPKKRRTPIGQVPMSI